MKPQKLTRKELYDLVWSTPFTTLAKRYLISDSGLRKICVKMELPVPGYGHWVKLKHNKPVKIKEFPQEFKGTAEVTLNLREEGDPVAIKDTSPTIQLEKELIAKESLKLQVPDRLTNPHKLIVEARDTLEHSPRSNYKAGILSTSRGQININVTRGNIGRALRFMDTFIKIIEGRGHQITFDDQHTYIVIQGEKQKIRLSEKLTRVEIPSKYSWKEYNFLPTGILSFSASAWSSETAWKDGKLMLEEQLSKIIAKLEIRGEILRNETIEREARWAQRREQERIAKEAQQRVDKEFDDFLSLLNKCRQWHEAETLRRYIDNAEAHAIKNNTLTDEMKKSFSWAREKANWYDPILASEDEYLADSDRDKMFSRGDQKEKKDWNYLYNH